MKKLMLCILVIASIAAGDNTTDFQLGRDLLAEYSFDLAAVEFRRYAMEADKPEEQSMARLHAAYAYIQAKNPDEAKKMLSEAEAVAGTSPEAALLHAELAAQQGDPQTALYFLDLVPESGTEQSIQTFKNRRRTEMLLRSGEVNAAREQLASFSATEAGAIAAVDKYRAGPRKNPKIGGWLGLFPGAGYWYSGETANGFRSLLLNSIFMYGMYSTAQDDQWGAFGVITFFEITWYTGSIYGGVDAAHRYNRQQLETCIDRLNVPRFRPDNEVTIPLFQLRVEF